MARERIADDGDALGWAEHHKQGTVVRILKAQTEGRLRAKSIIKHHQK
jgi:hypothetical protein